MRTPDDRIPAAPPDPAAIASSIDPAHNPHDTFVKRVLTSPEAAGVELRLMMPPVLVARLDWATLRVVPSSFVDPSLAEHESDILYAIDLAATGRPVFVYVLLEHQSTLDRMMAWRFYGYLQHIWERWAKEQPGSVHALPLIVPLLMVQGPHGWTAPRRLSALFDLPPELAASLAFPVDLVFEVDDLREVVLADQLARDCTVVYVEAARVLLLLSRASVPFDSGLEARIAALGPQFALIDRELGPTALHTLLRYVTSVLPPGSPVRDRILALISPEQRTMYLSVYDEMKAEGRADGFAEGRADGFAEGRADGKVAGQREALFKLLAHRNLALDEALRARLLACTDEAQIERWFDRALVATAVADVFAAP
jgi:predicted transposase YdaD